MPQPRDPGRTACWRTPLPGQSPRTMKQGRNGANKGLKGSVANRVGGSGTGDTASSALLRFAAITSCLSGCLLPNSNSGTSPGGWHHVWNAAVQKFSPGCAKPEIQSTSLSKIQSSGIYFPRSLRFEFSLLSGVKAFQRKLPKANATCLKNLPNGFRAKHWKLAKLGVPKTAALFPARRAVGTQRAFSVNSMNMQIFSHL